MHLQHVSPAAAVVAGLGMLRLGSVYNLLIAAEPGQAGIASCLGLEGAPFLHQLVALQGDVLLQVDGAGIERGVGFNEGGRDGAGCFKFRRN